MEEFRDYINIRLRAPTREPLDALLNALYIFLGTDSMPADLIGKVMVFDLQKIATLYRYRFTGLVERENIPRDRLNKKYFEYDFDEDAIAMDLVEV
jgi:hypothetical protein